MKPKLIEDVVCPTCNTIATVALVSGETSVIWCAEGHVTISEPTKNTVIHLQ
jgi:uncharacterized protein YbaR (Trm112 family)